MNFENYDIYDLQNQTSNKSKINDTPSKTKLDISKLRRNSTRQVELNKIKPEHKKISKISSRISPFIMNRSRHIKLNKSNIMSTDRSTDPIHFTHTHTKKRNHNNSLYTKDSIKKILDDKNSSKTRKMIFQRRNHSVIEYIPQVFNVTEINNTREKLS